MREAGYQREGNTWRAPEFVSVDRLTIFWALFSGVERVHNREC